MFRQLLALIPDFWEILRSYSSFWTALIKLALKDFGAAWGVRMSFFVHQFALGFNLHMKRSTIEAKKFLGLGLGSNSAGRSSQPILLILAFKLNWLFWALKLEIELKNPNPKRESELMWKKTRNHLNQFFYRLIVCPFWHRFGSDNRLGL